MHVPPVVSLHSLIIKTLFSTRRPGQKSSGSCGIITGTCGIITGTCGIVVSVQLNSAALGRVRLPQKGRSCVSCDRQGRRGKGTPPGAKRGERDGGFPGSTFLLPGDGAFALDWLGD